jgi:hypothetical protein
MCGAVRVGARPGCPACVEPKETAPIKTAPSQLELLSNITRERMMKTSERYL